MSTSLADGAPPVEQAGREPPLLRRSSAQRPSSARPSLVQQKLQSALLQADKTSAELAPNGSFRLPDGFHSQSDTRVDRSVTRYRGEAAAVSFTEPATAFTYAASFMPGVHFYTFLAGQASSTSFSRGPRASVGCTSTSLRAAAARAETIQSNEPEDGQVRQRPATARRQRKALRINVPDTILYGETGHAVWIYTDSDGFVQRLTEFSDKQVMDKFADSTPTLGDDQHIVVYKEPIATLTTQNHHGRRGESENTSDNGTPAFVYRGNQLRLLNLGEVKALLNSVMSMRKAFALQHFVKCNGSKAFVQRAVYEAGKPAHAWMISNITPFQDPAASKDSISALSTSVSTSATGAPISPRLARSGGFVRDENTSGGDASSSSSVSLAGRLCTSVQVDKSCTFVKLTERGCATVSELNLRIVKYIERRLRLPLQTFVADFVKDASGEWWLLQVKAFQVKSIFHPGRAVSLPLKLRLAFLSYRDPQILDEDDDSNNPGADDLAADPSRRSKTHHHRLYRREMAPLAHRNIHKLVQCKCCLAAYPKSELSFKMTLKMINDMLVRIRSRLGPEKNLEFLTAALTRDPPESALAYESWSVCSFCYAIYERDQQLQRIETKFSAILGLPSQKTLDQGLSRIQDRSYELNPSVSTAILPPQLTLCHLVLVINAIYDIPPELYRAEMDHAEAEAAADDTAQAEGRKRPKRNSTSRLYLRINALGYTECIPINAEDILQAHEKAPGGARRRRDSMASVVTDDEDDTREGEGEDMELVADSAKRSWRSLSRARIQQSEQHPESADEINYWLPMNLIRTIPFFAPRTPLQAKLKETSGITPFLTEDNSVRVQLIRATEPPLQDPTVLAARRRPKTRRAALVPRASSMSELVSQMHAPSHSIVLGSTKIRMAQFRSAYVTKIDYYACMAITGEMLNIKGNIGLERVRYVDSKLLTSQHRLRTYNGVFVPDESYTTGDPLTSEWMDCFRASSFIPNRTRHASSPIQRPQDDTKSGFRDANNQTGGSPGDTARPTASRGSLLDDDEEMDQELEQMIDQANFKQQQAHFRHMSANSAGKTAFNDVVDAAQSARTQGEDGAETEAATASIALQTRLKQELLPDEVAPPARIAAQMAMLLNKPVLSTRSEFADESGHNSSHGVNPGEASVALLSQPNRRSIWSFVLLLNQAHHLHSRERSFCRWECHYTLFTQKRSAIERMTPPHGQFAPTASASTLDDPATTLLPQPEVQFTCTHKFFLCGTAAMVQAYVRTNPTVTLHFRNDMYASTRSNVEGEFYAVLDLMKLHHSRGFDTTIDILRAREDPTITPREAAVISRVTPYLSLSVQLSRMTLDPDEELAKQKFVELGRTVEGLQVLRKIS